MLTQPQVGKLPLLRWKHPTFCAVVRNNEFDLWEGMSMIHLTALSTFIWWKYLTSSPVRLQLLTKWPTQGGWAPLFPLRSRVPRQLLLTLLQFPSVGGAWKYRNSVVPCIWQHNLNILINSNWSFPTFVSGGNRKERSVLCRIHNHQYVFNRHFFLTGNC